MKDVPTTDLNKRALWREIATYIALASAPVAVLAVIAARAGGLAHAPWVAPAAMFAPALAAIATQKFVAGKAIIGPDGLGLRLGRLPVALLAFPLMAILVFTAFGLSAAHDPLSIKDAATLARGTDRLALPQIGGPFGTLGIGLMITLFVAPVVNLPLMLGEEIGWRGFLTPRLVALLGRRGVLVAGLVWACWHLPIIALGYNYPQHPVAGFVVFVGICAALSVLFTALTTAGRSVLPAALAHGVLNQLAAFLMATLIVEARWIDWLHAPVGLAMLAVLVGPAMWIYLRRPDLLGVPVGRLDGGHMDSAHGADPRRTALA